MSSRDPLLPYEHGQGKPVKPPRLPQQHPPAPEPPKPASVFAGIGVFVDEPWRRPSELVGLLDWVALRSPVVQPPEADWWRANGFLVHAWEEPAEYGMFFPADGYIATAEGPQQLADALRIGANMPIPKALICNDTVKEWPPGWFAIPEAYTVTDLAATADQMTRNFKWRGATLIAPCIEPADQGKRVPLASYGPALDLARAEGAVGFSVFRLETLVPEDVEGLRELQRFRRPR